MRTVIAAGLVLIAVSMMPAARAASLRQAHRLRSPKAPTPPAVPLNQIRVFGNLPAPFAVAGSAADLVALHSGAELYAFNEHAKTQPASLAKIMTFYLTLEALKQGRITLDTQMPVSETAWRLSLNDTVSRMFLQVGQKVAVRDLLYGLMVSSGNDAAVVLSEYLAGSTTAFAEEMNKKAAELGMTETHFTNPDGLPQPGEYTTAADMVKLGRALLENFPNALEYTSTKVFTFKTVGPENRPVTISQRNFNTLLFYDSRVNGIKTGHVDEAGYHLVASAHTDDLELISAVFGTSSMEARRVETDKLLEWAFQTFITVHPNWHKAAPATVRVYEGDVDEVPIAPAGGDAYFTVVRGQEGRIKLTAEMNKTPLVAPVAQGTTVGQLTVMLGDKPLSSQPIVTQAAVKPGSYLHQWMDALRLRL
ncbi:MAG TPA: D-alanyl-D-alanine carboxypeptidase family protein [Candidatus Binataceae bacterium]|jgi:D-alanyl-D-alanine carboxypeptidase (penicillin-binding protein 5/6)|nr:D-alanyl-D-alanine carboxypeptidase family protein [Candidatus Binataceae bacterium]